MAVMLCRSDGKPAVPIPDQKKHQKIIIKNDPLFPAASQRGKKVINRSEIQYASEDKTRDETWRNAYQRRSTQLNCGFHGSQHKPYHDLGKVTLDDRSLFVEGLGQSNVTEQVKVVEPEFKQQPTLLPLEKFPLRAKTSSQLPTQLLNLSETLENIDTKLALIRKGRGFFQLLKEAEIEKQRELELKAAQEDEAKRRDWKEGIVYADFENVPVPSLPNLIESDPPSASANTEIGTEIGDHVSQCTENGNKLEMADQLLGSDSAATHEHSPVIQQINDDVSAWYYFLCVILWVLEAMRMASPLYMPSLHDFWQLDHPKPNEQVGKRIIERQDILLSQWDSILQRQKSIQKQALQTPGPPTKPNVHMDKPVQHLGIDNQKEQHGASKASQRGKHGEGITRQKKLTATQLENLITLLDEELNYSKKQTRARLNDLIRDEKKRDLSEHRMSFKPIPVTLDVPEKKNSFLQVDEERKMIVHEQLAAMERDRKKALQQRFTGLKVTGNLWEDLSQMRDGVHIESTSMAKKKLLMNYSWYSDLYTMLPPNVKTDQYCCKLLGDLRRVSEYTFSVGPKKMSRQKMIQVLSTLRPWELNAPVVSSAVEFLITKVIYIAVEDYAKWMEFHTLTSSCTRTE